MNKDELKRFEEILREQAKRLERAEGADAKRKGKHYKPAADAIRMLLNYIALNDESPISVECEKRGNKVGFKAIFKGNRVKFFG